METLNSSDFKTTTRTLDRNSSSYLVTELFRYFGINFICLISVLFLLVATFLAHRIYNYAWKPFKK